MRRYVTMWTLVLGYSGDVNRNAVSLSGRQAEQKLWSLPVQNMYSTPAIRGSCWYLTAALTIRKKGSATFLG